MWGLRGGTSGGVGYVGLVELVEFRLRVLCGACGALGAAAKQREKAREKAAVRQRRGVGGAHPALSSLRDSGFASGGYDGLPPSFFTRYPPQDVV